MAIKYGCHGSTWVLDYDKEVDMLDEIMDTVEKAGFKGIDMQVALLGKYKNSPESLKEELDKRGLQLVALTHPFAFEDGKESAIERESADYYINYLQNFPNAIMNVPSRIGPNRDNLLKRQKEIMQAVNELGKRAYENGVGTSFHPLSSPTSYFRTAEDYEVMFNQLDTRYIGYTPDTGHITFGGMDAVDIIRKALPLIRHVHFKDGTTSFEWKKMGQGDIDFPTIVQQLTDYGYKGWIMVEEETDEANFNTEQVIVDIGGYVRSNLQSIVKQS
jgi:inosose dehydratase